MQIETWVITGALAISLAPCSLSAQATAPEATENAAFGDITVTAQRREERLQETPVAVTALSGDTIADLGISEVEDIAKAVPNLQLLPVTANPSNLQVGLRGGAEQGGGIIVSEPVVGIYVDDVYRARLQGSNAQLGDIERIEVLRGPQGTLYGRNNFSGAIKIITKDPSRGNEWLNGSVGYGSFDEIKAQASIGRALTDTLGASLSILYRDVGDGYIFNRARDEFLGREENFVARGKIALDNGPLSIVAALSYSRDRNDGYVAVAGTVPATPAGGFVTSDQAGPRFGDDLYVTQYPQDSLGITRTVAGSVNIGYEIGAVTLRSISGYVDLKDRFRWDLAGGLELAPGVYSASFDRDSRASAKQFSQELQLSGATGDGRLNWITGLFFFRETGQQSLKDDIPLFGLPNLAPTFLNIKTSSYAVFGQASYDFTDRLSATLGGRYTIDEKKFGASIQSGFGTPNPRATIDLRETYKSFTPKLGLDYKFSDAAFGYLSVSKGFKSGGFNGLAVLNPLVLSTSFQPQNVWAYEAGLKTTLFDQRLRANLTFFMNDISQLQQTARANAASFPVQNVGDARVTGIEAELAFTPVRGFNLFANIGYQDGTYKNLNPNAQAAIAGAREIPLLTEWTVQGGFDFERGIGNGLLGRIGLNGRYNSNFFPEVTNVFRVEGFARFDAFAAIRTADRRWEVKVEVNNLTDRENIVSGLFLGAASGFTVLKPRTWLLSVNYSM